MALNIDLNVLEQGKNQIVAMEIVGNACRRMSVKNMKAWAILNWHFASINSDASMLAVADELLKEFGSS